MPFLRVDAYEGRSKEQVKELLDAIHRAILSAFGVPLRDRYQVYQEHSESNFIVQDTGLGIDRTKNVVFIGITSRQRTEEQKTNLYTKLVEELKACDIVQSDIVVSIVTNSDADWSFGNGRAQFLTGELCQTVEFDVMVAERRGQVIAVELEATGYAGRWHEPVDTRVSRPVL